MPGSNLADHVRPRHPVGRATRAAKAVTEAFRFSGNRPDALLLAVVGASDRFNLIHCQHSSFPASTRSEGGQHAVPQTRQSRGRKQTWAEHWKNHTLFRSWYLGGTWGGSFAAREAYLPLANGWIEWTQPPRPNGGDRRTSVGRICPDSGNTTPRFRRTLVVGIVKGVWS